MSVFCLCLETTIAEVGPATGSAPPEVRLSVVDADTGAAIPTFRVLRGSSVGDVSGEEFRKNNDVEVANWQPHLTEIGKDGKHVWPLARAWDKTALRVEADGYIPQIHTWIVKAEGARALEFKMKRDPGVAAKVLLPDGKPASHALVSVALIHREVRIIGTSFENAGAPMPESLRDRWQRPPIAETNRGGEFRLMTETDPAAVVVAVHPKGICEMPWAEFEKAKVLRLQQWGRVEGKMTIGDRPGSDVEVTLGTQRQQYAYPGLVSAHIEVRSDAQGRFVFESVPPGRAQVSLFEYFPEVRQEYPGLSLPIPPGGFTHVEVKPGKPAQVELGGKEFGKSVRK